MQRMGYVNPVGQWDRTKRRSCKSSSSSSCTQFLLERFPREASLAVGETLKQLKLKFYCFNIDTRPNNQHV